MATPALHALVKAMRWEADGVLSVELRPATPSLEFPPFTPGSHIDLHLGNGLVRSYSLCNASDDRKRYVVAILNDKKSRGGSRYVHQQLRVGAPINISAPRNNFKLAEHSNHSVLVAGGIGITPIWCVLQHLLKGGESAELIYCARSRREAAFLEAIDELAGDKVPIHWHFDEEAGGPPDPA